MKNNTKKKSLFLIFIILMSGCTHINSVLPVENYAYLEGSDFDVGISLFSKDSVSFIELDTSDMGGANTLNIHPGQHTILAKCKINDSLIKLPADSKISSIISISMFFERNFQYEFSGRESNGECRIHVLKKNYASNENFFSRFSSKKAKKSYDKKYITNRDNKAFAQSVTGFWSWRAGEDTIEKAKFMALQKCKKKNEKEESRYPCEIIDVNGSPIN
jgi:hypothetical protein